MRSLAVGYDAFGEMCDHAHALVEIPAAKVESHLLMRHYSGFMKKGRIKGRVD